METALIWIHKIGLENIRISEQNSKINNEKFII